MLFKVLWQAEALCAETACQFFLFKVLFIMSLKADLGFKLFAAGLEVTFEHLGRRSWFQLLCILY